MSRCSFVKPGVWGIVVWGEMFGAAEGVNGFLRSLKALKVPDCWKAEEEWL